LIILRNELSLFDVSFDNFYSHPDRSHQTAGILSGALPQISLYTERVLAVVLPGRGNIDGCFFLHPYSV
jgi:hypothetical protein